MAKCDTCGNDYWLAFEVKTITGDTYTFDSFECAIGKLAPSCEHCKTRIIGHGVEVAGRFFCGAHCAREGDSGLGQQIRDTVGAHPG
ncbi:MULTISPECIES: Prokaryotic metallothionein [Streptomyces]|uniref:Prokaryotic metallothionein n=1 Tax=Streptomyces hesseae TaxID=3075519 RepID=A0ABU2SN19_9ACTN|nr:Prokaryotic metallothionein [Streptomyces sp. DSM 40473]MDT0450373.1 Prokaryotic metallothionein [Streptomyces sp. DSM 40473]